VIVLLSASGGMVVTEIAGGLLTVGQVQAITMTNGGWGGLCSAAESGAECMWSSGLALDPSTGQVLMTTTMAQYSNDVGHNYSLVFDSGSVTNFSLTNLSCAPSDPYYPGSGPDFYIPCDPPNFSSNNGSLLTIDLSTNQVVGRIPLEGFYADWYGTSQLAWDPVDHLLYACAGESLLALNTTSESTVFNVTIPDGCGWLVYDAISGSLLVSGTFPDHQSQAGLSVVEPQSGQVLRNVLSGAISAGAVYVPGGLLAVGVIAPGSYSVGSFQLVNASTFEPITTIPLPASPPGQGETIPVQIITDPAHGDLYVIAESYAYTINVTEEAVLAEATFAPSGFYFPSIYLASTGTLYLPTEGLIQTITVTHSTGPAISSLLWLPTPAGILVVAGIAGAFVAIAVYLRRSPDSLPPRTPAPSRAPEDRLLGGNRDNGRTDRHYR